MQNIFSNMTGKSIPQNMDISPLDLINIRKDIIGELDAINMYSEHILETKSLAIKTILTDIMHEEQIHVGELMNLLFHVAPSSKELFDKGILESNDLLTQK